MRVCVRLCCCCRTQHWLFANGNQRMGKWIDEPYTLHTHIPYRTENIRVDYTWQADCHAQAFMWIIFVERTLNFVAFLTRFTEFLFFSCLRVCVCHGNDSKQQQTILMPTHESKEEEKNLPKKEAARAMLQREWYPSQNFSWKINQREKCVVALAASRFHINPRKFHSLSNLHIISQSERKWENK